MSDRMSEQQARELQAKNERLQIKLRNVELWIESVRGIGVGAIDLRRLSVIVSEKTWEETQ
jgi:hypothetical protein